MTRALRVIFCANDGASLGHVARTIALARAMKRISEEQSSAVSMVLVTTSHADAMLANEPLAVVRLPSPGSAESGGLLPAERRRISSAAVEAVTRAFAPDLAVVDTFPLGPFGELEPIVDSAPKLALVRRAVRADRADDPVLKNRVASFDLAILADDANGDHGDDLGIRSVRVAPITILEPEDAADRAAARAALGISADARAILVVPGGGADREAMARAVRISNAILELQPGAVPVVAQGPLARGEVEGLDPRVMVTREAPLQRVLSAFDGAFAAAGYNAAHELAKARVPAVLFAEPRAFDDQAARARRLQSAGHAFFLESTDAAALPEALAWMRSARCPGMAGGGADRAARALFELATGGSR